MVVTTVLRRTRLTTRLEIVTRQFVTGTACSRRPHTLYHVVVSLARSLCIAALAVQRVHFLALYVFHDVRRNEPSAIGNCGSQVGNLQRSGGDLTLSDGNGDDGQSVPRLLVAVVVIVAVRNHTSLLARQVDAQRIAEAHRYHVVAPNVHGVLGTAVFRVSYHIIESPAEIAVT